MWIQSGGQIYAEKKSIFLDHECILTLPFDNGDDNCFTVSRRQDAFFHDNNAGADISALSLLLVSK